MSTGTLHIDPVIPVEEHEGTIDQIFEKSPQLGKILTFPKPAISQYKHRFKTIWVTFQREGIHCYPAAKDIPGVEFLANPHRHIFHFRVEISVKHDDREIEFILFKRQLQMQYDQGILQLDYKSCEMIAQDVIDFVDAKYPGRYICVTVSEDNENGATITHRNLNG